MPVHPLKLTFLIAHGVNTQDNKESYLLFLRERKTHCTPHRDIRIPEASHQSSKC